ncbi:hypothetical protein [Glutamicibacter sp.]|uniref:hypothetical protein n=1 Tax=Glutamicibacter sp. TaxID=1931995 RepID=UPI0028BE61D6|nr:hypothetical protein [Glutamicibacter sp.]
MNNEEQTPVPAKNRNHRKVPALSTAAAIALIAVGGSAYAASSMDGNGSKQPTAATSSQQAGGENDDDRDDKDQDDDRDEQQETGGYADASTEALRTAAQAALNHANAQSVTSIEVERSGYEVEVQFANHDEQDLFVAADGSITASEVEKAEAEDKNDPALDVNRLEAIKAAALTAANTPSATLDSISTSDDAPEAYEVELRTAGNQEAEINLDSALKQVNTED